MGLECFVPDWPCPANVHALQTTRRGGVSQAPWQSFNLGTHVGDDSAAVEANRAALRACLPSEPLWLEQVHGIVAVDPGKWAKTTQADACVSRTPGAVCVVMTADCLPVLFCDRSGSVVASAHAGWRGLQAGILENTVQAMKCPPEDVLAWLGPAIGPGAFEVGDEVRQAFMAAAPIAEEAFVSHGPGKWLCDLYRLARQRLTSIGVTEISGGNLCTFSDTARFYSYRRDGVTGRMASLIWLAT